MKQELLEILEVVREEEREILEEGAGIRKDNPGIIAIRDWIDAEYARGRTTSISDNEMREQVRLHLPEVL